jgi:hypothetical protein
MCLLMRSALGYSAVASGAAYLPLCFAVGVSSGIGSQLLSRSGTRPAIVVGALVMAGGLFWLSRVDGSYLADVLPGTLVVAMGIGPVFAGVATATNTGVPEDEAGRAAALLTASQQFGGAIGLAILTAIATSRTTHRLASHIEPARALTEGVQRGLLIGSVLIVAAAALALGATNTRGAARGSSSE